ncbi:phosphatidylinositol 3,4,5-trisphosphate 5-phosphatase 2-like [Stylophora pistillata]|uniref:phosphatidylinositol-3,4,5-trisphosphate 5-phosphatase n=1 Tax=Stylophora pistillata TaxID=50429 RepID=A0A2B4S8D5_STYPI|nr:phosphatidylinositol 3,4,5-trisphosphate 5-phosphatase 2-like [Stylophora pistillata]PFX25060.1 Phosphatidylinositol 3,4,5-trisphosphate 5-phosphatase 2 [Stylophora pistillata]
MSFPWHQPDFSRIRAEELLLSTGENGSFLIRDSESIANVHVLSLLHEGRIHHYRILREESNGNFYMQAVPGVSLQGFSKLEDLVTFYSQGNMGLPCELRHPAVLEDKDVIDDDSDDEDDDLDEPDGKQIGNEYEFPSQFMPNVDQLDSGRSGEGFGPALGLYLGNGIRKDMEAAVRGKQDLEEMQQLLARSSTNLIAELQFFLTRVNMLQNVFGLGDQHKLRCSLPEHSAKEEPTFKLMMDLLAESIAGAKSLQAQAINALKEVASINQEEEKQEPERRTRIFEVLTQGMASSSFKNKVYIMVNFAEGRISFLKNPNDVIDANNSSDQSRVIQLVKSKDDIKRLRIKLELKPSKDYEFDDGKSRELFCQLVQQMKNQYSKSELKTQVRIFIGTWNMGNADPPRDIKSWLKCQGNGKTLDTTLVLLPHDIYAIGTQECPVNEKDWISRIKENLKRAYPNKEFHMLAVCSSWSIRLVVFINQDLKNMVSHLQQSSVKTGIANALGNKGGVGISFSLGSVSLCFINCHLAARSTPARVLRRNQNFLDILKGLNLGQKGVFDITHQFHHVFWFGDLNYRIDMEVQEVLNAVGAKNFAKLKNHDQLKREKEKENVFVGFEEEAITFAPTYRYKRGSGEYTWQKNKRSGVLINVPSWCDRVLKHSFPQSKICCTSYGCTANIKSSDHWPVFCTYDMSLPFTVSPDQSPKSPVSGECVVRFLNIGAMIKTTSRTQYYVEFHSSCLEEMVKTEKNSVIDSRKKSSFKCNPSKPYVFPEWGKEVIPPLYPMISDRKFIEEQYLLLAIKSVDNDESYGECCIALRTMVNVIPQKCEGIILSHLGEKTGEINIEMHVKVPDNKNTKMSSQSFDLISVAHLEENNRRGSVKTPQLPQRKSLAPQDSLPSAEKHGHHGENIPPAVPKRHSAPQTDVTKAPREPPPLPAKKSKPKTVEQMMDRIGFPQFTGNLLKFGADNLELLYQLNEQELSEAGIPNSCHNLILGAIKKYAN